MARPSEFVFQVSDPAGLEICQATYSSGAGASASGAALKTEEAWQEVTDAVAVLANKLIDDATLASEVVTKNGFKIKLVKWPTQRKTKR